MVEKMNKLDRVNRRCGFSRRSFTYAHHIPERRKGIDRRDSQDCDLELVDQNSTQSEQNSSSTENKHDHLDD